MNQTNKNNPSKLMWFISISLILFVISAFGLVSIVQPDRMDRYVKPFVVIHIFAAMGWLVLFAYQSRLILNGQIKKHKNNSTIGIILVAITTIFSIVITYQWGLAMRVVGESRDVIVFAILFFAAIVAVNRGRPQAHKRLMLIASLNLINPAITRVKFIFDLPDQTLVLLSLLTWILVPVFYDLKTIRGIHKATLAGIIFTLISFAVMIVIVLSPWMDTIESFLYPN